VSVIRRGVFRALGPTGVAACLWLVSAHAASPERPARPVEDVMTVDRLVADLQVEIDALKSTPKVRLDFAKLAGNHAMPADEAMFRDYLRVKTAFEATREAGWWRVGWTITDREPRSDAIWTAWRSLTGAIPRMTAVAECDESSALLSVLLRRLGVRGVGLFWPTSNHTVAVWKVTVRDKPEARIVLPTSQVFLAPDDGLDTRAFDPRRQRVIYDYTRADVKGSDPVPGALGRFFLAQVRRYAAACDETQRGLRILRGRFMAGEDGRGLEKDRKALAARLRAAGAADADLAAVEAFAEEISGS
jgi:hypothetical protein